MDLVNVTLGGMMLVSGEVAGSVRLQQGSAATVQGSTFDQLVVTAEGSNEAVQLSGGEIGGLLKSYNSTIPGYLGKLDQVAGPSSRK